MQDIQRADDAMPSVSLDIDKNDLVAIAVSRAETRLNELVKHNSQVARDLDKQAEGIKAKLEEESKHAANLMVDAHIASIVAAFARMGTTVKDDRNYTWSLLGDQGRCTLVVTFKEPGENHYGTRLASTVHAYFTPEQKSRAVRHQELLEQAAEARSSAVGFKRQLGQLDTLERQVRATLAEQSLRKKKGGEELLAVITQDLDERIKALPGN